MCVCVCVCLGLQWGRLLDFTPHSLTHFQVSLGRKDLTVNSLFFRVVIPLGDQSGLPCQLSLIPWWPPSAGGMYLLKGQDSVHEILVRTPPPIPYNLQPAVDALRYTSAFSCPLSRTSKRYIDQVACTVFGRWGFDAPSPIYPCNPLSIQLSPAC